MVYTNMQDKTQLIGYATAQGVMDIVFFLENA
jgi:hypothetical protein